MLIVGTKQMCVVWNMKWKERRDRMAKGVMHSQYGMDFFLSKCTYVATINLAAIWVSNAK